MQNNSDLKIQYWYWREFLKRSKAYKEICNTINLVKKISGWPEVIKNWCTCDPETTTSYLEWISDNSESLTFPEWLHTYANFRKGPLLLDIYPLFQDIHNNDFEDLWNRVCLFYNIPDQHPSSIFDGHFVIVNLFKTVERILTSKLGREPTISEFRKHFFNALAHEDRGRKLFSVASFRKSKNVIIDQFRSALNEIHERESKDKPSRYLIYPWAIYEPTGTVIPQKFDEYLRAYDIKKSASSASEAVKIFAPGAENELDDKLDAHERRLRRYYERANRLIHNAERANFPGNYG